MKNNINIALIGNPNTGKTSLFNRLTGLHQKVGNYPGVTVDKKQGLCDLPNGQKALITDLPGIYSINPTSLDESVVLKALSNPEYKFDAYLVIAEVENLKRNLLLFSQLKDLGVPMILVINMVDQMSRKGISIDIDKLKAELDTEVILISTRNKTHIESVKQALVNVSNTKANIDNSILSKIDANYFNDLQAISPKQPLYKLWLSVTQNYFAKDISNSEKEQLLALQSDEVKIKRYQHKETIYRYQRINEQLTKVYTIDNSKAEGLRSKLDRVFTHKIFGYFIFFGLLALIFQSIFEWSSIPMDFIDALFTDLSDIANQYLPEGKFTDLLTNGIIAGIGGVVIFVPQIIILFLFIALLEETGYMSRVVFIMDRIMRKFGLSGKSIFPLISGTACAVPAVMAARTISNWKERLITILVTPFITCGARLPVYAVIIALIIPDKKAFGFGLQGLTLLALYALGFIVALIASFILDKIIKKETKSFFVAEMPDYKLPSFKNVAFVVYDKTKAFVVDAGKIILAISIILWFLGSHGGKNYNNAEQIVAQQTNGKELTEIEKAQLLSSVKLENSYIGVMGKAIEPIVKPLGYDWKIGIALITSFAAREVFVGTLSTIYSVEEVSEDKKFELFANLKEQWTGLFANDDSSQGEEDDENSTIKSRMQKEINQETGQKRFNLATGMSLLMFYAFAMQCMATLAIVKRETKSWKWPLIQLFGMGAFAYISALITYVILK